MHQILDQLTALYPKLSPQLKLAAKAALDQPEEIAIRTMRGFAAQAGVAPSTMVRLAKSLNLSSYESFRAPFQQALRRNGKTFSDQAHWLQALSAEGQRGNVIREVAESASSNITSALLETSPDALIRAAALIRQAKNVYVSGIGAMHCIGGYFQFVLNMALPNVVLVDPVNGAMLDDLATIGAGDVLVMLATAPYAAAGVQTTEVAYNRGAKVIALTDSRTSPIAPFAEALLVAPARGPMYFPSQTAIISVLEALISLIVSDADETVIERIRSFDNFRNAAGLYWEK